MKIFKPCGYFLKIKKTQGKFEWQPCISFKLLLKCLHDRFKNELDIVINLNKELLKSLLALIALRYPFYKDCNIISTVNKILRLKYTIKVTFKVILLELGINKF